jgi:hypothetical protein
MTVIISNSSFTKAKKTVKPDTKNRVILPKELVGEDITFNIYSNSDGQIVLDPQVTIPASELWLFRNPEILAQAKQGLSDAAKGKVSKINLDTL